MKASRLTVIIGSGGVAIFEHRGKGRPHLPRLMADAEAKTFVASVIDRERMRLNEIKAMEAHRVELAGATHDVG